MNLNIFSDLRKPGLVPGESLSPSIKIDSVKEKYLAYNMTNRMRSFHMKLINILKRVKTKTGLDSNTYKSMYPTGCVPPTLNSAYNKKKYAEILLRYRWPFIKGNVFVGE